jgi:hypothetical protein
MKIQLRWRAIVAFGWAALLWTPACPAATFTWTGAASTDWFNTNNWSPAGLPGLSDTVNVSSGTINLSAPVIINAQFNWSGGTLTGNALTIGAGGTNNWTGGTAQCPINVQTNGVLILGGSPTKYLWNTLSNAGTVTWSGSGNLEVDYSTASSQYGQIQNQAGALWDIQNSLTLYNNAPNGAYFQNAGTLRKSADSGTTTIAIPILNSGTVTVLQGTLRFNGGGTLGGTFNAASGATVNFNSGPFNYTATPTLTGPGTFQMSGGSLMLVNDVIPNLQLAGGTLTLGPNFQGGAITNLTITGGTLNSSSLTVGGVFNWAGTLPGSLTVLAGGTVNWGGGSILGPVMVASNGVLNLSSNNTKYLWGPLTNAGTVTWAGSGNLEVDNSSANNYYGLIQNLAGAVWDIQSSQTLNNGFPYGAYFQNAGTVRKSANSGNTTIGIPLYNSGAITAAVGTVTFTGGGTLGGSIGAASGSTVNFNNGTFSYTTPPILTGPGTVELTGGSLTLVNDIIPNLVLAGGTVSLGPNFQGGTIANLTLTAGTLTGNNIVSGTFNWAGTLPGSLTVQGGGAVNWTGGIAQGPVLVASNGVLNLSGNNTKSVWSAFTNAGTVTWSGGGGLEVDYSSTFNEYGFIVNMAGALWDIQNNQNLYNNYPNGAYFQNAGTLRKSGGSGTTTISLPFYNSGSVSALVGTIAFNNGAVLGGSFNAAPGATISFNSGTFSYTVPPILSGPGTLQLNGGTLTLASDVLANLKLVSGTVSLGPSFQGGTITNLTLLGGTLTGNNTVSGTFNWGGDLQGSLMLLPGASGNWGGGHAFGPVNVSSNAVLTLSGFNTKYLWNALTNAGTVVWTGNSDLEVDYSTSALEYGLIQNLAGALWDIQNSQNLRNNYNNGAYFQNAGIVRKSADSGTTTLSVPFNNSGTVFALIGTLSLSAGGAINGAFDAAPGTHVSLAGGAFSYTLPPALAGAGAFQLSGGSLTLINDVIAHLQLTGGTVSLGSNFQGGTITNLTLLGGVLNGNNTVSGTLNSAADLTGSLTVQGGATVNWSGGHALGPIQVANNAVLNITGGNTKYLWNALTNAGTVTLTNGTLYVDYNSAANDYGLIENLAGGLWDIQGDLYLTTSYNTAYFRNAGTVRKSVGGSFGTVVGLPFYNLGNLQALQGTVNLNGGISLTNGTLTVGLGSSGSPGQFNIPGNATLSGTLNVAWLGSFAPGISNLYSLVTYGSHSGAFTPLNLPASATWQVNYSATALTVLVTEIRTLAITTTPGGTNAGAVLTPLVVQVKDGATGNAVATNGLPVTVSLGSGTGTLIGTLTRNTDATGKATFNDLSVNLVGTKSLLVSAPGLTPATSANFVITPAAAAKLALLTPIGAAQLDEAVLMPAAMVQVQDQFGNALSNSTATITAQLLSGGGGSLGGTTTVNADGATGSAAFTNLVYALANHSAAESMVSYFSSPGLVSATNPPVRVNFVLGPFALQSGNSVLQVNPGSQAGVFSWKVDGVDQLFQQWFWVRLGAAAPQVSIDSLGPAVGVSVSAGNATLIFSNSWLGVTLGLSLAGGSAGSHASVLAQTLTIQNPSNSPIVLHVFQYADFDLAEENSGDSVSVPSPNQVNQTGKGMTLSQTIQGLTPSSWEASFYSLILDKILSGSPITLSDEVIPPAPGDQTFAVEWDANLAPGQTLSIGLTDSVAPTPSVVALAIAPSGSNIMVSWPAAGSAGYQLQCACACDTTSTWAAVTNAPVAVNDKYQVILPLTNNAQFFRLKQ